MVQAIHLASSLLQMHPTGISAYNMHSLVIEWERRFVRFMLSGMNFEWLKPLNIVREVLSKHHWEAIKISISPRFSQFFSSSAPLCIVKTFKKKVFYFSPGDNYDFSQLSRILRQCFFKKKQKTTEASFRLLCRDMLKTISFFSSMRASLNRQVTRVVS